MVAICSPPNKCVHHHCFKYLFISAKHRGKDSCPISYPITFLLVVWELIFITAPCPANLKSSSLAQLTSWWRCMLVTPQSWSTRSKHSIWHGGPPHTFKAFGYLGRPWHHPPAVAFLNVKVFQKDPTVALYYFHPQNYNLTAKRGGLFRLFFASVKYFQNKILLIKSRSEQSS